MQTRFLTCFALAALLDMTHAADTSPNILTAEDKAGGWKLLFDGKTTNGWRSFKKDTFPAKGWDVQEGWLHCEGKDGGDILTTAEFNDFELEWDWKQVPKGNSGLKYFITESRSSAIGHEYQLIDDDGEPDAKLASGKHTTGAFYDVLKPERAHIKPPGEVNHSRILVRGNHVEHWLNGVKVLEYSCGSELVKDAVAQSKFKKVEGFGSKIKGHILLQDHHTEAWFRNIKIREISER